MDKKRNIKSFRAWASWRVSMAQTEWTKASKTFVRWRPTSKIYVESLKSTYKYMLKVPQVPIPLLKCDKYKYTIKV